MKSKKVLRYYSDCGKGFWKKQKALKHESNCKCWTNHKNKTCKTCKYVFFEDTGYGGSWGCNHPNKYGEHNGAPNGINYISVNCIFYEQDQKNRGEK